MNLAGEIAVLAIGVDRILSGTARWGIEVHARSLGLPRQWTRAIRAILAGESVDKPPVVKLPRQSPVSVPEIPGAPDELQPAMEILLTVVSSLDDEDASDSVVGPLLRPLTIREQMERDLLWRTVSDPMTVLYDASHGGLSSMQLQHMDRAFPGVLATWRMILDSEIARLRPEAPTARVRHFVSMLKTGAPAAPPPEISMIAPPAPKPMAKKPVGTRTDDATAAQKAEAV